MPGTEEPGGLPSMESQRARHDSSDLAAAAAAVHRANKDFTLEVIFSKGMSTELPS